MCSVVVVLESGERPSISIAANRDEDRGRPAEGPRWRETGELSSRAVFAPRDLKAGGTWWGLNDVSLLVAVTNRMTGRRTQPEGWRSRGLLVSEILGAQTLEEAQLRLEGSDLTETRGFHLLVADLGATPRVRAFVHEEGADTVEEVAPERDEEGRQTWVLTERSHGASETTRPARLLKIAGGLWAERQPSLEELKSMMASHEGDLGPGGGHEAPCVHIEGAAYGTRSSFVLRGGSGAAPELQLSEGPPCRGPWRDASAELRAKKD